MLWSLNGSQHAYILLFAGMISEFTTINYSYLMGFRGWRMGETNFRPLTRTNTGVSEPRIDSYAILLRHLWLGYGLCLGFEFVELTLGQEDSVNTLL
jgi:hypothetical protein